MEVLARAVPGASTLQPSWTVTGEGKKKQNNDVGGNRRADGGGTGREEVGSRRAGVSVQPAVSRDSSLRALMRRTLLFDDNAVAREHRQ